MHDDLLTTSEVAAMLRVSQKTVMRMVRSGRLRADKVGRAWRIRCRDLPCRLTYGDEEVIYLDDNASNPMHPAVADAVTDVFRNPVGNASSAHELGQRSRNMVEQARERVAELVAVRPNEVVFTSGATEANNLILRGYPYGARRRVLITAGEHDSVLRTAEALADTGMITMSVAPLTPAGTVDVDWLEAELRAGDVSLVSVVAANSDTGVLNPIRRIADLAHTAGATIHCDATQWVGRLPWSMADLGVDVASMSAHKMSGPQGVGALVGRRSLLRGLQPTATGGGHEHGLRSGTYNVAGIVGFGVASALAAQEVDAARMAQLRDRLVERLGRVRGTIINGATAPRLPNTASVMFEGAAGDAVLSRTPGVAASLGSACHAGSLDPSPTLLSMGLSREEARSSIRFSITRFTTEIEIDRATALLSRSVDEVREVGRVA